MAIGASDADGDPLAYAIKPGSGPQKGVVSFAGGSFVYTPNADANGADSFTLLVSDGKGGTAERLVEVTINAVNDAPTVAANGQSVSENAVGVMVATVSVGDVDTPTGLTFRILDGTSVDQRFVVTASPGTTLGQPGLYEIHLAAGQSFDFEAQNAGGNPTILRTIEVNDGQAPPGIGTRTFTITITDILEAPIATDDVVSTSEDTAVTISVAALTANDTDPQAGTGLTITGLSNPVHGTVSLSGNNIVFVPTANFSGEARFDYTLSNGITGAATDTGSVRVNVTPVVNAVSLPIPGIGANQPLSDDVVVNTTTANEERVSSIAAVDGGYVITWTSFAGNDWNIYARRYAADGTPLGSDSRVNTSTADNQQFPSAQVDSSVAAIQGGYVVTWTSHNQDGSGSGIYAQRYASDGTTLASKPGSIRPQPTTRSLQPVPELAAAAML